jgi:hypothetical protein
MCSDFPLVPQSGTSGHRPRRQDTRFGWLTQYLGGQPSDTATRRHGDTAMGRCGETATRRWGEWGDAAAPIGRAKNSARRGPCFALCLIRAGFEPFRAASCLRKLSRTPTRLYRATLLEENNRRPRLKTGATYRNIQETPWARRVFRPTGLGSGTAASSVSPITVSPFRRFAASPQRRVASRRPTALLEDLVQFSGQSEIVRRQASRGMSR